MKYQVGDSDSLRKSVTEKDVNLFAEISGDFNPLHIDECAAKKSVFKQRVCHGMLTASLISAVLGTRLPGSGTIILEQRLKYINPVFFGDMLEAKVEIIEIINLSKGILRMKTSVNNQKDEMVIIGECIVKAPL